MSARTVWVVGYSDPESDAVCAIYSTREAAEAHVALGVAQALTWGGGEGRTDLYVEEMPLDPLPATEGYWCVAVLSDGRELRREFIRPGHQSGRNADTPARYEREYYSRHDVYVGYGATREAARAAAGALIDAQRPPVSSSL